jgi:archaeosine synthase beta-subunit
MVPKNVSKNFFRKENNMWTETIMNDSRYKRAKEMLLEINHSIKQLIPDNFHNDYFESAGFHEIGVSYIDGKEIERVIIILKGCGCEWAHRKDGGCTMCGHLSGSSNGKPLPMDALKKQFDDAIAQYDFKNYPKLCVYNGGSLLNEREIPTELRRYMFNRIREIPEIKRLIIESRPVYIKDEILDEIEELLPDTTVEIGIGVETANDKVRDLILNKGVSSDELRKVGKKLRNRRTKFLAYVLVRPPFLTEAEAIEDTVESIKFAAELGADIVSLEAVSIQDLTMVAFLAEAGFYSPPWIWSIFEIVNRTYDMDVDLRIGGFEFYPIPKEFTSNCPACDKDMINIINQFNRTNDIKSLYGQKCPEACNERWKIELEKNQHPNLVTRVISTLEQIDVQKILKRMTQYTTQKPGITEMVGLPLEKPLGAFENTSGSNRKNFGELLKKHRTVFEKTSGTV